MAVTATESVAASRKFLQRLWRLENRERPGLLIGYTGPRLRSGAAVPSALFSTAGPFSVRQRLQDPQRFLEAQLQEITGQLKFKGDFVPALCPTLGVVAIPSAFGCEVAWWENDFPAVRPLPGLGENPQAVYELLPPSATSGELGRILEHTRRFIEKTGGCFPVRLTDIQGPLDSAALIMGHTHFLAALRSHPDEVHRLLQLVTDLTIGFVHAQRELVLRLGAEFVPSLFQPWLPDGWGISVSNDECVMMSADLHDEFSLPYLNRIADAFGGVYLHSCGNWLHQIPSLEKIRSLRGLEFGASETPFEPVWEHFGEKTVIACRIGLHRVIKFRSMADFVQRIVHRASGCRGLFIHADITNGLIDDSWPETDLEEIYQIAGIN